MNGRFSRLLLSSKAHERSSSIIETKRRILEWLLVNRSDRIFYFRSLFMQYRFKIHPIHLALHYSLLYKKLWEDLRRWTILLVLWIFDPLLDRRWNRIGCIIQFILIAYLFHTYLCSSASNKLRSILENSFSILVYDRYTIEERTGTIFVNLLFFFRLDLIYFGIRVRIKLMLELKRNVYTYILQEWKEIKNNY